MPPTFKIVPYIVNATDFVPIITPVDCDNFVIDNSGPVDNLLWTHDPTSGVVTTIYAGNQWSLIPETPQKAKTAVFAGLVWRSRHSAGETVGYLKGLSSRTINVTFVW